MGRKVMKLKLFLSFATAGLCFLSSVVFGADIVNVYINNSNNANNYNRGGGYSGVMCTRHSGFCANEGFVMSSGRTIYAPAQWKRQTLREKRISYQNNRYSEYEY